MNREQTVVLSFYLPQKGSKLAHTETLSLLPPPKIKENILFTTILPQEHAP
jgi:hypothetical protein